MPFPVLRPLPILFFIVFPLLIFGSALLHSIMRFLPANGFLLLTGVRHAYSLCETVNQSSIDLSWDPPNSTSINDLATVINGTGVFGFIFNTSITLASVSYSTYNWCNMPHVRPTEYIKAPEAYKLEYVELVRNL